MARHLCGHGSRRRALFIAVASTLLSPAGPVPAATAEPGEPPSRAGPAPPTRAGGAPAGPTAPGADAQELIDLLGVEPLVRRLRALREEAGPGTPDEIDPLCGRQRPVRRGPAKIGGRRPSSHRS
jgi:hypothetical protein